ncbi:hypothetical protein GCM10028808_57760 [Spirosoma migulaei]
MNIFHTIHKAVEIFENGKRVWELGEYFYKKYSPPRKYSESEYSKVSLDTNWEWASLTESEKGRRIELRKKQIIEEPERESNMLTELRKKQLTKGYEEDFYIHNPEVYRRHLESTRKREEEHVEFVRKSKEK